MFIQENNSRFVALKECPAPQAGIVHETGDIISITGNANPTEAAPIVDDSNSVLYKLRGAMENGDTNLFELLQIALDELVKIGHSEASSLDLT